MQGIMWLTLRKPILFNVGHLFIFYTGEHYGGYRYTYIHRYIRHVQQYVLSNLLVRARFARQQITSQRSSPKIVPGLGLDKICLAKFEKNGQPKEKQFCKQNGLLILSKKQNGQRMSFEFLDCMALATSC